MVKRITEIAGKWIASVAQTYYVESGVYELVEDYGCTDPRVTIEKGFKGDLIRYCCGGFEEFPCKLLTLEEAKENEVIDNYRVEICRNGRALPELLINIGALATRETINMLLPYSAWTHQSRIEYLFVLRSNGKGYLIEGEESRVYTPLNDILVSVHTHPDNCVLSPHDVRSLKNILMNRGFGGGVIAQDCYFTVLRVGPFLEEDMMELIEFGNALKRLRADEINNYLRQGYIGTNLRIYTNYSSISMR